MTGDQREDRHPHVYERTDIAYEFEGPDLDVAAVRRAIELSATRYCTASATFNAGHARDPPSICRPLIRARRRHHLLQ